MVTVLQRHSSAQGQPLFLCDVSPPRGGDLAPLERAIAVNADFLCVAYAPGSSVRADPTVVAHLLLRKGCEVIFNIAVRDMNRLALQSHLLGADLLGLENLIVLRGDALKQVGTSHFREVHDLRPSELLRSIRDLNNGLDFRGLALRAPTRFCLGSTLDLGRDSDDEIRLAQLKMQAGAQFFITQGLYDIFPIEQFLERYQQHLGQSPDIPVFYGIQIPHLQGLSFSRIPHQVQRDLDQGRQGVEMALELAHQLLSVGINTFYLIPPILPGGRRDYHAAQQVVGAFRPPRS